MLTCSKQRQMSDFTDLCVHTHLLSLYRNNWFEVNLPGLNVTTGNSFYVFTKHCLSDSVAIAKILPHYLDRIQWLHLKSTTPGILTAKHSFSTHSLGLRPHCWRKDKLVILLRILVLNNVYILFVVQRIWWSHFKLENKMFIFCLSCVM